MIEYGNYKGVEDYMNGYRAKEKEMTAEDIADLQDLEEMVDRLLAMVSPQAD